MERGANVSRQRLHQNGSDLEDDADPWAFCWGKLCVFWGMPIRPSQQVRPTLSNSSIAADCSARKYIIVNYSISQYIIV